MQSTARFKPSQSLQHLKLAMGSNGHAQNHFSVETVTVRLVFGGTLMFNQTGIVTAQSGRSLQSFRALCVPIPLNCTIKNF